MSTQLKTKVSPLAQELAAIYKNFCGSNLSRNYICGLKQYLELCLADLPSIDSTTVTAKDLGIRPQDLIDDVDSCFIGLGTRHEIIPRYFGFFDNPMRDELLYLTNIDQAWAEISSQCEIFLVEPHTLKPLFSCYKSVARLNPIATAIIF